jgi:hypothetical protein
MDDWDSKHRKNNGNPSPSYRYTAIAKAALRYSKDLQYVSPGRHDGHGYTPDDFKLDMSRE